MPDDLNAKLSQKLSDGKITLHDVTTIQTFAAYLRDAERPGVPRRPWVYAKWGPYLRGLSDGPVVELRKFRRRSNAG